MKQSTANWNTLRSLISSTVILRFCFGCISLFGSLLGLYIEQSVIYNTFHTGIGGIANNTNMLFFVIGTSLVLIGDAILSFSSIIYRTKFVKFMCKILLKIRLAFWIPGIFVFLSVSYYTAYYGISNNHISDLNTFIVSGYYLSIAMLGVFSFLNESIVANNMVRDNCNEKN